MKATMILAVLLLFSLFPAAEAIQCYVGKIKDNVEDPRGRLITEDNDLCILIWNIANNTVLYGGMQRDNDTRPTAGCMKSDDLMECECFKDLCFNPKTIQYFTKMGDSGNTTIWESDDMDNEVMEEDHGNQTSLGGHASLNSTNTTDEHTIIEGNSTLIL